MKDKRGQDLPTGAIILIILGLAVAVVLIIGFTRGWETFSFWLPKGNVQSIVTQCNVACSIESTYDFCSRERTLKATDLKDVKEVKGSCKDFVDLTNKDGESYGIKDCPALC